MTNVFSVYFKTNYLLPTWAFCFINSFFALFLAAILFEHGISPSGIALHYMLVFLIPFLIIRVSTNSGRQVSAIGVLTLIPIIMIFVGADSTFYYTYLLASVSGLAITSRDQIIQFHQQSMLSISMQYNASFQALSTASLLFTVVLSVVFSFLLSFLIPHHTILWSLMIGIWLYSVISFYRLSSQDRLAENAELDSRDSDFSAINIPLSVTAQCAYSMILGSAYYVGKFFLLPVLVLEASARFGLEKYSFTLIATVIGIVSMLGMVGRLSLKMTEFSNLKLMKYGYRADISVWMFIFITGYLIAEYNITHPLPYILLLLAFVAVELTSKLWTVGFFGVLKEQSEFYQLSTPHPKLYQRFMSQFGSFKSLGGVVGFTWVFMTGEFMSLYVSAFCLAATALLWDAFISNTRLPVIGKKSAQTVRKPSAKNAAVHT